MRNISLPVWQIIILIGASILLGEEIGSFQLMINHHNTISDFLPVVFFGAFSLCVIVVVMNDIIKGQSE